MGVLLAPERATSSPRLQHSSLNCPVCCCPWSASFDASRSTELGCWGELLALGGKGATWAICAVNALVLLWEEAAHQAASLGGTVSPGPRWEHSICNCRAGLLRWATAKGGSSGLADSCSALRGRGLRSYLGGHEHAGAHPCEEVGDLSAHGTAPPGPLAPASPAQQRRFRARPDSRQRSGERRGAAGDLAGQCLWPGPGRHKVLWCTNGHTALLCCPEPSLGTSVIMLLVMWMVLMLGFSKIPRISEYPFCCKINGEMGAHIPEAVLIAWTCSSLFMGQNQPSPQRTKASHKVMKSLLSISLEFCLYC